MQSVSIPWNNILPAPGRVHGAPPPHPLTAHAAAGHHGHPGGPPSATAATAPYPVTIAQQQQRETLEREARDREREAMRDAREREHREHREREHREREHREHREREREQQHMVVERLHRPVDTREHAVVAQQRTYYAPPAQQVCCAKSFTNTLCNRIINL